MPGFLLSLMRHHGSNPEFSIHGLWPEPWVHSGFVHYKLDLEDIKPLMPDLRKYWHSYRGKSDAGFWRHEFEHHGEFMHHLHAADHAGYTQYEYFATTLRLYHEAVSRGTAYIEQYRVDGGEYRIPVDGELCMPKSFAPSSILHSKLI